MKTLSLITMKTSSMVLSMGLLLVFAFTACETSDPGSIPEPYVATPSSLDSLKVPEDFSWSTTRDVSISLDAVSYTPESNSKISVYSGNQLLAVGRAGQETVFENTILVPAYISELSVVCTFPSGNEKSKTFDVTSGVLDYSFAEDKTASKSAKLSESTSVEGVIDYVKDEYTWVFEDFWPYKGDYDFNDLVASEVVFYGTDDFNNIAYIKIFVRVDAAGAYYKNGLGMVLRGMSASDVQTNLSIGEEEWPGFAYIPTFRSTFNNPHSPDETYFDYLAIILFDDIDADQVLNRAGNSWAHNTLESQPEGTSNIIAIDIMFENPVPAASFPMASFGKNLFLLKDGDRETEIHLVEQLPTGKVNAALFGTGDDGSEIGNQTTLYRTKNTNLPWALVFKEGIEGFDDFEYPIEEVSISKAYPRFIEWAESGGEDYPQWYIFNDPQNLIDYDLLY